MVTRSPLEGVRVVEWTQWQQGPVAGMMLGDLGADVIKVEEPIGGDPARGIERAAGLTTFKSGRNAYFENNNRNKRSITLNLKTEQGREILLSLTDSADVFLHNFLPQVADRLGLNYECLAARNPRLIYAVASGYGPKGPDANTPSFDYTGLARSGIMTMVGEPSMPPLRIEGGVGDQMGAVMTAYAVVTALFDRERTGLGQRVDVSLLGSLMWLQGVNIAVRLIGGNDEDQRRERKSASSPLWNYYRCADGKWVVLAHLQADRFWPNLCRALGIEDLRHDSRFASADVRSQHAAELIAVMDEVFATRGCGEWLRVLAANGCIATQINDFESLVADPAALANDYIIEYDHPTWGAIKTMGFPVGFGRTPCGIRMPAPEHGQHTEEILTELLGYGWDRIVDLNERGIV